jgi:hypothetical protein
MGGIDGDLIVGGIAVLHAQIVVFDINVQEREDKLFLDHFPDNSGLFVAIELDDGIVDLDLLFHYVSIAAGIRLGVPDMAMREVKKFLWGTPTKFALERGLRVRRASCVRKKLRGALDMQALCGRAGGEEQGLAALLLLLLLLEREIRENDRCGMAVWCRVIAAEPAVVGPFLLLLLLANNKPQEMGAFRRGRPRTPRLTQPDTVHA